MKIVAVLYPGGPDCERRRLSSWDVRKTLLGCVKCWKHGATNWSR